MVTAFVGQAAAMVERIGSRMWVAAAEFPLRGEKLVENYSQEGKRGMGGKSPKSPEIAFGGR